MLNWEKVYYLRAEKKKGRSYASIAKELGVSAMTVWHADKGRTWKPE
jgi:hypothetical protein